MAVSRRPAKYRDKKRARHRADDGKPRDGFILTVVDGANLGQEYFFASHATIGRVEENDIVLVEPGMSRNHVRIYDEQGIFLIQDLGSANGTRLNGEKLTEPEVLKDGDYITLASTSLQFSQLTAARGEVTSQISLSDAEAQAADATGTKVDLAAVRGIKRLWRSRVGKASIIAGVALLAGLGYYIKQHATGQFLVVDQSDVPLTFSDDDTFFNAVVGYGKYDHTHRNHAIITFEYLGGRATLQYGAWGVDRVDELAIRLNGQEVGKVPLTMNRWVYGLRLLLPRDTLKRGANELVFNNTLNPPGSETWEICYIQLIQEAIPPPDPQEAQAQFDLAKKAWEDQDIEPGNMYSALDGFKRARDLLEGLAVKPALYQDALDSIDKVDKTLTRRFSEGLFSARRAEKVDGDLAKARMTLIRTLRYFQKDDFRYREVQRQLDALAVP